MTQTERARERKVEVLERGNIHFAYRPRVGEEKPQGLEDVQQFYVILSPHGESRFRLAIMGRRRLPEPKEGDRYWGFIAGVSKDAKEVEKALEEEQYTTQTRGERRRPTARPAGEGVYAIARHEDHTHLVYALELPERPREVQEAFGIVEEASYILQVKNPEGPSARNAGLPEHDEAKYPKDLQERFRGRRFVSADPPEFLNHEGAEFLLVGSSEDVKEELGLELNPQRETEDTAEIFNELRLRKTEHPVEPLLKGTWA